MLVSSLMVQCKCEYERVPFTFADWNPEEVGSSLFFVVIGKTTRRLPTRLVISCRTSLVLCEPTEMYEGQRAVIGGGVGLAIAFLLPRQLVAAGREVHAIMALVPKSCCCFSGQFRSILTRRSHPHHHRRRFSWREVAL